jgi:hypothetical protein
MEKEKQDLLLGVDGTMRSIFPSKGDEYSLREAQAWVGGYIEIVRLDDEWILVVNEDGIAMGLAPNEIASQLVRRHIVGDAAMIQSRRLK